MGSNCCKNVRVAGIPQQDPSKISFKEDLQKNITKSLPQPLTIAATSTAIATSIAASEQDSVKTIGQQMKSEHQVLSNDTMQVDDKDKTISMRLNNQLKVNHPANDSKLIIASKLPPIRKYKTNAESKRSSSNISNDAIVEKTTHDIDENSRKSKVIHLPKLQQSLADKNDDHLLESISDETHSQHDNRLNDDWYLLPLPERDAFDQDDRFFTSTPIPPSPDQTLVNARNEIFPNQLFSPLKDNNDSNDEDSIVPLSLSQVLRFREQLNAELSGQIKSSVQQVKPSSRNLFSIPDQIHSKKTMFHTDDLQEQVDCDGLDDPTIYLSQESGVVDYYTDLTTKLDVLNVDAFDEEFIIKRQHVIENSSYRLIIEAWRPSSIEQLVEQIRNFVKNKPTIDRLWIVFYWIARNIEYDTVPYVGKKHVDKSAESVFRTRKAIGDGYANLFKRLCDDLDINCEKIHGYCKTYVFDHCNKSSVPQDHAWNAVQINNYWYLLDVTWSAGHLEENRIFKRELNSYFFLIRSNEIIYHHFPAEERWQLLKHPIKMAQYMLMPRIWPHFFQLGLQLFSPHNIIHVDLVPTQSFALVLIQSPRHVALAVSFKLNDKDIDGGHRLVFDKRKRLYRCYFAPNSVGLHIIRFLAKNNASSNNVYNCVIELEMDVKQIPSKLISFPKTWKIFYDLNLEIVWPCNTHLIKMNHGDTHIEIIIRAPIDVELLGRLTFNNGVKVLGGHCLFIDRRQGVWRCFFAPHCDGMFEAIISARRRLESNSFSTAVRFKIKAKRIPMPPLSYPKTWQLFHDLDLQVENPHRTATVLWPEYGSYAQVCIRAPDDVRLMGCIEYKGSRIENASLTQYNREKQYWQMFFAPERTGEHQLLVFAQCNTPDGSVSGIVVEFHLDVNQIRHTIKFPVIYGAFLSRKCRIYEPINGLIRKGTTISLHFEIPNARQVDITVDSKWIRNEGYKNSILRREIITGNKEVIIYAKFDENTVYNELIKYIVQ